ncbi:MAG: phosphatase PAP2 family protein [bacterium]|nr:phosphatase PAP2 family protein [bacterium]MDZ4232089.1 phosphatase PAP2 family protein [Candidatus Pacearchaeota archaeon]
MDNAIVFLGEYLGHILAAAFLVFWWENRKRFSRFLVESAAAAILSRGVVTELIRFLYEKPRPFVANNVEPLLEHAASPSFPSGHAAFFFALGGILYAYNKTAGILFLLGAAVMSSARVFAGLHWHSDIIAGALVGLASAFLVMQVSRRFGK